MRASSCPVLAFLLALAFATSNGIAQRRTQPRPLQGYVECMGFRYRTNAARVFPSRVIGGNTNLLASLWAWEDGTFKPRPLEDWDRLEGTVARVLGNEVTLTIERREVAAEYTEKVRPRGNRMERMGLYQGSPPIPKPSVERVTGREYRTVVDTVRITNIPPTLRPAMGQRMAVYAYGIGNGRFNFGHIPQAAAATTKPAP